MTQFRRRLRSLATLVVLAFTLSIAGGSSSGCYGQFAVTKKLYDWNGSIGNKFLKTVVLWAFIIIPAYELLMLGDFLIFNLIEFWTGKNPIGGGAATGPVKTRVVDKNTIELRRGGQVYRLTAKSRNQFELSANGRVVARGMPSEDGGLVLTNLDNKTVRYIDAATVAKMRAKLAAAKAPAHAL